MWKRDNCVSVIHYPFHFFSSFLLLVEILLDIPTFKFSRRGSEFPVIYWIFRFLMKYGIRKQISCPCSCSRNPFPTRDFVQDWTFETFRFFLNQLGDLRDLQRRSEALLLICVVVFNSRKYVLKFSNLRGMFFKCFISDFYKYFHLLDVFCDSGMSFHLLQMCKLCFLVVDCDWLTSKSEFAY